MKHIITFIFSLLCFTSCVPTSQVYSYDPAYGGPVPSSPVIVNPGPSYYRPWYGWYYRNPLLVRPYLGNAYYTPSLVQPVRINIPIIRPKITGGPRGGRRR